MALGESMARRHRRGGRGTNLISCGTKSEAYSFCYYYYHIFEKVSNLKLVGTYDDYLYNYVKFCDQLGKTERLTAVLKNEVQRLEKNGLLVRSDATPSEATRFCESDFFHEYEQDKRVERKIDDDQISENTINIFRILFVTKEPVFSTIINTVVFDESDSFGLKSELVLSKKARNMVNDFSATRFLVEQVNLSETEARYILLRSRLDSQRIPGRVLEEEFGDKKNSDKCIAKLLGISYSEYREMLRADQKLKSFGFIEKDEDYDSDLDDCIIERSIDSYFSGILKPLDCSKAYSLDSFAVKKESVDITLDLLKGNNPVSILFYGKPGAGKTELAKSICKETGKKVYIFKNEVEAEKDRNILGRLVCLLSMDRSDSVLVVDEADSLLKTVEFGFFSGLTPTSTKGTINKMLEENKDKVIYIINHQRQIDESTRRRFTFSIKFESMPTTTLRSIAKSKLEPMNLSDEVKAELLQMLDKYHLTGASVDNLVKMIEGMDCSDNADLLRKAEIVMKENSLLLNGKSKMRETVKAEYDPKVLNASMSPLKIVEMVENAAKFAEQNKGTENGIRMLFYGLSGTGKTELARYISGQLGKHVVLKRASDILSPYVGEDEQNIRDAFAEAESSDSILLFDEADTFFYDRNQAQRTWERSLVNEFLTQMEEFSGILICTTNLRNVMDPAMQRRFHIMVEFKPMKFEGIKVMAERYFPNHHLSNTQIEELEDMESATPGDFGALASRIRFMDPDDVDSDYIFEELKKLQTEKKKQWSKENGESEHRIGFTA